MAQHPMYPIKEARNARDVHRHQKEIRMNSTRPIRFAVVGLTAFLALAPQASASPGQGATPTLNPPPFVEPVSCKAVGNGTICMGDRTFHEDNVDTGLTCGSGATAFNPVDQSFADEQYTLYYDQAGNLTRFTFHDNWYSAQWVNPQSGTAVPYTQTDNYDNQLAVPGDFGTKTTTHTGEAIFKPAHSRTIFLNAGRVVYSPDGSVDWAGPQSFLDLFVDGDLSVLEPLCAALQ
jgi:hypothetical protein